MATVTTTIEGIQDSKDTDMPTIQTAEQAIARAESFLARYYVIKRLQSVRREKDSWWIVYDVSIFPPKEIVEITLDAGTGDVTAYGPVNK